MTTKNKSQNQISCRLGKVGGQAVIEGVMMKSGSSYSIAVRKPDGSIAVTNHQFHSVRSKHRILNIPVLRGIVNYVEMMILSYRTLSVSAQEAVPEGSEEPGKFEQWIDRHLGKSFMNILMAISSILGIALGIFLFSLVPTFLASTVDRLCDGIGWFKNLIEGLLRILIFILYISLTGLVKDIRRLYQYHGAEHKSIFCFENGEELTPENAKKQSRLHPRCGTSFLFVMLILSILIFSLPFVTWENYWLRLLTKLALLPLIVGIGYEFIMYAGKHNNLFVRIVSFPGLMMQKITTREPDLEQLEVAITALKCAMPELFPETFKQYANASDNTSVSDGALVNSDTETVDDKRISSDRAEDSAPLQ